MNNHTLISVLQATKGVRTVKVKFSPRGEPFTYKTTLDLKPDQFVVAETRECFSVGRVVAMDETPDVLREDVQLKWVVQAIDTTQIDEIREEEARLVKQIALSEAKRRLDEVIKDLNLDMDMPALRLEVVDAA